MATTKDFQNWSRKTLICFWPQNKIFTRTNLFGKVILHAEKSVETKFRKNKIVSLKKCLSYNLHI